jgi:hypothetical protein
MRPRDQGPPGRERPGATPDTGPIQQSADTTTDNTMICPAGAAEWFRRHRAGERLTRLDCGCRDPWPCKCSRAPLSQRTVDGGRAAALHLRDRGLPPLVELDVVRGLWRRGGDDRQLARELYQLIGGDAA